MARGRKPGFVMPEAHRAKIANSNILNALVEHVEGRRDMSSTQVSAALGLLRKVLPDLSAVEQKLEVTTRNVVALPEAADSVDSWKAGVSARHRNDHLAASEGAAG